MYIVQPSQGQARTMYTAYTEFNTLLRHLPHLPQSRAAVLHCTKRIHMYMMAGAIKIMWYGSVTYAQAMITKRRTN